ncbi:hypothetical protein J1605_000180 [Eschrichtius robustus]|uniref:Uncharacterized protein n=1 Tax=Eschrichtius robustus TaxID=9764 RepID=A0AB34HQM8_ESCRO|nr:hypothetical protein J1605_000180 [Eschrichtius robustus]
MAMDLVPITAVDMGLAMAVDMAPLMAVFMEQDMAVDMTLATAATGQFAFGDVILLAAKTSPSKPRVFL